MELLVLEFLQNQRLIGTDSHRKYVESLTPGATTSGIAFINKYKIRKS